MRKAKSEKFEVGDWIRWPNEWLDRDTYHAQAVRHLYVGRFRVIDNCYTGAPVWRQITLQRPCGEIVSLPEDDAVLCPEYEASKKFRTDLEDLLNEEE